MESVGSRSGRDVRAYLYTSYECDDPYLFVLVADHGLVQHSWVDE